MKSNPPILQSTRRRATALCRVAVASGLLLSQGMQAALYLQEGFDYAPGILGTNNPPWTNPADSIQVADSSLTYPNLADSSPPGGSATVTQGSLPSAAVTHRLFDAAATNGSVYFSFLIKFTSVNASSYIAGLLPPTASLPNGTAFDPCDLYVRSATGGYNLGVAAKNGTIVYKSFPLALNTVYFVVLKYDLSFGRASFFLTPSLGGTEPASSDASSTGIAVAGLNHLYLRVSGSNAGSFIIDTLRVGQTWGDVTPLGQVPPASRLIFAPAPNAGTAGATLASTVVQIQNDDALNIPSNNVPITVTLSPGGFAGGTTTVNSDAYGRASFSDLVVGQPGDYILTATASGIGAGLRSPPSRALVIGSTNITDQGRNLSVFLDSLQVERYWENGKSVNWLTGAAGGTGPYMTKGTNSHCSAFAAGAANVLGVFLLCPPNPSDLGLANNQADWLLTNKSSGWYAICSAADAQHIANIGALVVASYKETDASGHIAVLRPSSKSDAEILALGPQECQSGVNNYNDTNVKAGFAQHPYAFPDGIRYYGHAVTNPIVPVNPILSACAFSNAVVRTYATSVVGRAYKLQNTADFVSWVDVSTYTNSNGSTNFFCVTPLSDSALAGSPWRFYRLVARP